MKKLEKTTSQREDKMVTKSDDKQKRLYRMIMEENYSKA